MGAVGTLIGAVIGAGATIYGSYQSKKAQEEAARIQQQQAERQAAIQAEQNRLQEEYQARQLEMSKQQAEYQKQFQEAQLRADLEFFLLQLLA